MKSNEHVEKSYLFRKTSIIAVLALLFILAIFILALYPFQYEIVTVFNTYGGEPPLLTSLFMKLSRFMETVKGKYFFALPFIIIIAFGIFAKNKKLITIVYGILIAFLLFLMLVFHLSTISCILQTFLLK